MLILVIVLGGLAAISCYLWLSGILVDFGLNAFTEVLGIAITVLIIDIILKRNEERKNRPQKIASYEDVRLLVSRIISFWSEAYTSSVPEQMPSDINLFFSHSNFEKILGLLDMDTIPNVSPKTTWWNWFPHNIEEHKEMANRILERHAGILDPIAYRYVHQIASEPFKPGIIKSIRMSDQERGFPRQTTLGNYFYYSDDYYSAIIGLWDWCESQFSKFEGSSLLRVARLYEHKSINAQPPSMISRQKLQAQNAALEAFRSKKS